jgi:hypothetical protein
VTQTMLPNGFVRVGYEEAAAMLSPAEPPDRGHADEGDQVAGAVSVLEDGHVRWWDRDRVLARLRATDQTEPTRPGIMRTTGLVRAAGYGLAVPDESGNVVWIRTVRRQRPWPELLVAAAAQVRDLRGIVPEHRDTEWQAQMEAVLEAIASLAPHPASVEMAARRWVAIAALNDDGSVAGTGIYDEEAPEEGWMLALPSQELAQAVVELHNREVDGVLEVLWGRERP